jgi:electron transfer flavoprotein beta subunit
MTTSAGDTGPNILVCIKFVPDPNLLQADPATGKPDLKRAPVRIGTFDENAIEAGLQLAGALGGRVFALSVCLQAPPRDVVLKALAMGVHAAYLVTDPEHVVDDALRTALVLAAAARDVAAREKIAGWDLCLCGEASTDEYNEQVGPRLAAALDLPCVTYATSLAIEDGKLRANRALGDRSDSVETTLPAVATVGMEINTARLPTVLQIMGAGRKPLVEIPLAQLKGLDAAHLRALPSIEMLEVFSPPSTRKQIVVKGDSVDAIAADLLRRLAADGAVKG